MIHQHQNPAAALFNTENFQELPSCGIEDVDRAVFDLFDKVLPLQLETDGEVKKVPVIYATGERAVLLSKRKPLRDTQGALILPLISVVRTGIEQDPDGYGISSATKEVVIKKKVSRSNLEYKRSINENNLSNQDHVLSGSAGPNRFTKRNFAWGPKNTSLHGSNNNIYEVWTMPAPRFFQCTYEITFWVHFQQQINSIFEAIMSSYMTPARQFMVSSDKGYSFTAILDRAFTSASNLDDFTDSERLVKSSVTLKVSGYVINPEGPGLMPQIKRYTSSPSIVFDTTLSMPVIGKQQLNVQSGDPADYIREHYAHEGDSLPGSMEYGLPNLPGSTATAKMIATTAQEQAEAAREEAARLASLESNTKLAKEAEAKAAMAAAGSAAAAEALAIADKAKSDILLGKTVKTSGQELLILDEDPITGAKVERKYRIKGRHQRKGETVLREVKILG